MKYIFLFITMLFLHIIDDFHCQGLLGQMKQKSFWEKVCKDYNTDKIKWRSAYVWGEIDLKGVLRIEW